MKCLDLIKSRLGVGDGELEEIKEDLDYIEGVLNKYHITFDDTFATSFYNHMVSFIGRAKAGEFVTPIEESIVSELTNESITIAAEMLEEIFNKYKREKDKSEIYLVSTHIQVAINNNQ